MPKNSRAKGARGERAWAKFLTDNGFPARRGQQFSGSPDSPDVVCESLAQFHMEVKNTERLRLYKALDQAKDDSGDDQVPLVVHKMNRKDWVVIMDARDFLDLLIRTGCFSQSRQ